MASYTYNDVLTRASTTIQVIEDVAIYKAQLFSTNGNIFSQRDTESELSVKIFKGLEDITDRFTDIVWKRFTTSGDNITEDNNWGQQHVNKKNITITRDDINEKANIQVEVYTSIDGERKLAASDFISFIDVNDMDGSPTPPSSPKDGDLWLDTSVMPPRLMVWDSKLGKWVEVAMAGRDRRNLLRNSNFFKKSTEYWTKVGNPTIEIESTNGKRWARIKSTSQTGYCGISQTVHATSKAQYSFQLLSEIYIQSAYPNGNIVVAFNSINSQGTKTLIKESNYDITENPKVFTDTFMSLDDTAKIEVIISGQKNADFDFVVTDTKLENYPTPTAWELAVEDMQEALDDKVGNTAEEVFNSLTDDGKMQGIYVDVDEHGQKNYYFNGRYVDAKNLKVTNKNGATTLHIDEDGNVALNVSSFTLTVGANTNVPTKNEVNNQIDNIQVGGRNLLRNSTSIKLNGSDYASNVDIGTPGKLIIKNGSARANAYVWLQPNFTESINNKLEYCFSVDVKTNYTPKADKAFLEFDFRNDNGVIKTVWTEIPNTQGKWVRISTVMPKLNTAVTKSLWCFTVNANSGLTTLEYRNPKLEQSNKGSDWSPAPEDLINYTDNKVNGIQVGGRNLVLGSNDFSKYNYDGGKISVNNVNDYIEIKKLTGVETWNTGAWIDVNAQPNTEYTLSFKVGDSTNAFVGIGGFGGTSECNHSKYGYHDYPANQKFIHTFTTKSDENKIRLFFALKANSSQGTYTRIKELKLEHGNKATDWSPAPEDIDESISGKVDVGGSIDDVNQSAGQIEYPKLKIKGAISFEDLNSENIGNNFVPQRDSNGNVTSTLINGATIVAGSITGDLIKAYQLVVTRRKLEGGKWVDTTIPTFSISQEGLIQASGTFKSFNFKGDESNLSNSTEGWIITNNGQSVFNDSIIRGRVELPNAGMTNYGGGENYNIFENGDFREYKVKTDIGWDNEKNGTLYVDWWNTYNQGVDKPTEGYHGHLNIKTFPFPVYEFNNRNSEIGLTNRWMAAAQTINRDAYTFKQNTKYTFSMDVYFTKIGGKIFGGLYHKLTDNEQQGFHSGQYEFVAKTADDLNKWQRVSWTFTTNSKMKINDYASWYIYGYGGTESDMFITKVKLEEGDTDTGYASTAKVAKKEVRMYAGTDYYNRYNAPLRILQDGTIIASRGEFGGTFTGRLEIGNISIYDDNTSYGVIDIKNNDNSKSIVRIGEDYSMFKSDVFFGDKDNYMFKTNLVNKQLVSGKQSSIRFEYERDEGDDGIFASSITISGHKIQFNENEFMKLIHNNTIQIGSSSPKSKLMLKSSHDSEVDGVLGEVDLEVHGNIKTYDTLSIGNVDMVAVYPGGGIDFFIN